MLSCSLHNILFLLTRCQTDTAPSHPHHNVVIPHAVSAMNRPKGSHHFHLQRRPFSTPPSSQHSVAVHRWRGHRRDPKQSTVEIKGTADTLFGCSSK
ncbi:hypothetical protein GWI33_013645 [Rhynchophorus ferrugineus]|uniref:Secreted protein n=1 Tax=Rhynchophorus ferrugineus TaxID=354439 RepID=A0A834I8S6_RHYFE|nr:hypothetical protein GWI33_013645 [Rhynchophorus ferrugineus]